MDEQHLPDVILLELAALEHFEDLAESVRQMQEENHIDEEDLRGLVFGVGRYRNEGRTGDLQTIVAHAMRIADALGWRRLLAELANIQGMNHLLLRQPEQAEPLFAQAAALWAKEGVPQEEGRSLINLAQIYFDAGDAAKANGVLEEALALAQANGLLGLEAQALGFIGGVIFYLSGLPEEARPHYQRAKKLYAQIGDEEGVRKIEYRLTELEFMTRRPEPEAVDVHAQSLTVREMTVEEEIGEFTGGRSQEFTLQAYLDQLAQAREQRDAALEMDTLSALSTMYGHLGHMQESITYAIEACAVAQRAGNLRDQVIFQLNLANIYYRIGDVGRAKETYQLCLDGAERLQNPRLLAGTLLAMGAVEGDYFAKLAYYNRAYHLFRDLGDKRNRAVVLTNTAIAHLDIAEYHWAGEDSPAQENLEKAQKLLEMAVDIWEELGATNEVAAVVLEEARFFFIQRGYARAVERLQKVLSLYQTVSNEAGQVRTLHRLAQAYWAQSHRENAMSTLAQAIDLIESRFDTFVAETVQIPFIGQSSRLYADMVNWCRLERPAEAFHYIERSRSRAFLDLMGDADIPQPASIQGTDMGREEMRLRRQLSALRLEFALQGDDGAEVTSLWRRYAQTNEELNHLLVTMDDGSDDVAAYIALRRGLPLSLEEVKTCLRVE